MDKIKAPCGYGDQIPLWCQGRWWFCSYDMPRGIPSFTWEEIWVLGLAAPESTRPLMPYYGQVWFWPTQSVWPGNCDRTLKAEDLRPRWTEEELIERHRALKDKWGRYLEVGGE